MINAYTLHLLQISIVVQAISAVIAVYLKSNAVGYVSTAFGVFNAALLILMIASLIGGK